MLQNYYFKSTVSTKCEGQIYCIFQRRVNGVNFVFPALSTLNQEYSAISTMDEIVVLRFSFLNGNEFLLRTWSGSPLGFSETTRLLVLSVFYLTGGKQALFTLC